MRGALPADRVEATLRRGGPASVNVEVAPRFRPGDRVRVRNMHTTGHTRAPRYCRGHIGTVERDHGVFIFPDTHALGRGQSPQHCYSVRFASEELWGTEGEPGGAVLIDLWDDYLDAVP